MLLAPYKEPLTGVTYYPHYWSTYCQHDRHGDCRLTCKTCDEPCRCPCHTPKAGQGLPTDDEIDALENAGCDDRMIQRIVDGRFDQYDGLAAGGVVDPDTAPRFHE